MRLFTQHPSPFFRLLLVIAMVLTLVESAFAMQVNMLAGHSMDTAGGHAHSSEMSMLEMSMLEEDCHEHGCDMHSDGADNDNCQGTAKCGHCPLSLGTFQIVSVRHEMAVQTHAALLNVPLYNADLSPDFRPPRYS